MVVNAVDPFTPQFAVVHAAHESRVFAWHGLLIAVAVKRPGLHLALVQLAAVQELMERMLVVIALCSDRMNRSRELLGRQQVA